MLKLFKRKKINQEPQNETSQTIYETLDSLNQKPKRLSKKGKIAIAAASLILAIVIAIGAYAFSLLYVKKDYQTVASFANLREPIQEATTGGVTKNIDGYEVKFEFIATYSIVGRVLEKQYYFPNDIVNKISRYDLGIGWGVMSGHEYDDYITFKNNKQRFLTYKYKTSLIDLLGSQEAFANSLSNNHVIHANEHVLKLLRNVKENQYIKIDGYLCNMTYSNKRYSGTWTSSTVRTDHGDGACEVIYVTNVTWLKL